MRYTELNRRNVLLGFSALPAEIIISSSAASASLIKVNRDPNCGCCGAWVVHLRQAGFDVEVIETTELNR